MELQEIMRKYLSGFGRYQLMIIAIAMLKAMPDGSICLAPTFFAAIPDHWCSFQRQDKVVNLTNEEWKRWAIPWDEENERFDRCQMYSWSRSNWTAAEINDTLTSVSNNSREFSNDVLSCNRWEYDRTQHMHSSLVIEWNMVCDKAWMRSTILSAYVIGWIVGTHIFGQFADRYGRKKPLLIGLCLLSAVHVISPFCSNYIGFTFLRCLAAFLNHGTSLIVYTYVMEAVANRYRSRVNACFNGLWSLGAVMMVAVAYVFRDWQTFMLVTYVPSTVIIIPMCFLPESLVWLADKGHQEEAEKGLRRMAKCNKKKLPEDIKLTVQQKEKARTRLLDMVSNLTLLRITLVLSLNWFVAAMLYYSVLFNTSDLHGNFYLNNFLAYMMELLCQIPMSILVQKLGCRWTLCITTVMSGTSFLVTLGLQGGARVGLILLAVFFISITFATLYQYVAELYPTVIRSLALSVMVFSARLGTFVAPYLPLMGNTGLCCVCGISGIVAGVLVLLSPETKGVPLPANVKQVQQLGRLNVRNIFNLTNASSGKSITRNLAEDEVLTAAA